MEGGIVEFAKRVAAAVAPPQEEGGAPPPAERDYRGVRARPGGKWGADILDRLTGRRLWLGTHDTREQAACAHDAAARTLRRNPVTNFPEPPEEKEARAALLLAHVARVRRKSAEKLAKEARLKVAVARAALAAVPPPSHAALTPADDADASGSVVASSGPGGDASASQVALAPEADASGPLLLLLLPAPAPGPGGDASAGHTAPAPGSGDASAAQIVPASGSDASDDAQMEPAPAGGGFHHTDPAAQMGSTPSLPQPPSGVPVGEEGVTAAANMLRGESSCKEKRGAKRSLASSTNPQKKTAKAAMHAAAGHVASGSAPPPAGSVTSTAQIVPASGSDASDDQIPPAPASGGFHRTDSATKRSTVPSLPQPSGVPAGEKDVTGAGNILRGESPCKEKEKRGSKRSLASPSANSQKKLPYPRRILHSLRPAVDTRVSTPSALAPAGGVVSGSPPAPAPATGGASGSQLAPSPAAGASGSQPVTAPAAGASVSPPASAPAAGESAPPPAPAPAGGASAPAPAPGASASHVVPPVFAPEPLAIHFSSNSQRHSHAVPAPAPAAHPQATPAAPPPAAKAAASTAPPPPPSAPAPAPATFQLPPIRAATPFDYQFPTPPGFHVAPAPTATTPHTPDESSLEHCLAALAILSQLQALWALRLRVILQPVYDYYYHSLLEPAVVSTAGPSFYQPPQATAATSTPAAFQPFAAPGTYTAPPQPGAPMYNNWPANNTTAGGVTNPSTVPGGPQFWTAASSTEAAASSSSARNICPARFQEVLRQMVETQAAAGLGAGGADPGAGSNGMEDHPEGTA